MRDGTLLAGGLGLARDWQENIAAYLARPARIICHCSIHAPLLLRPVQVVVVSVRGDKVSLSQRSADEIAAVSALTVRLTGSRLAGRCLLAGSAAGPARLLCLSLASLRHRLNIRRSTCRTQFPLLIHFSLSFLAGEGDGHRRHLCRRGGGPLY